MMYEFNKHTLTFTPIKQSYKQGIIGFILACIIFTGLSFSKIDTFIEKIPVLIRENKEECSPDNIKNYINSLNLEHKDIIYAQILLETGQFTSIIYKNNSNLTGMKLAKTRVTTAIGEELGHAKYNTWKESILDIGYWQSCYARNLSKEQYLQLLGEVYAEDEQYINKLKKLTQ